jgi:hypothetical protein
LSASRSERRRYARGRRRDRCGGSGSPGVASGCAPEYAARRGAARGGRRTRDARRRTHLEVSRPTRAPGCGATPARPENAARRDGGRPATGRRARGRPGDDARGRRRRRGPGGGHHVCRSTDRRAPPRPVSAARNRARGGTLTSCSRPVFSTPRRAPRDVRRSISVRPSSGRVNSKIDPEHRDGIRKSDKIGRAFFYSPCPVRSHRSNRAVDFQSRSVENTFLPPRVTVDGTVFTVLLS